MMPLRYAAVASLVVALLVAACDDENGDDQRVTAELTPLSGSETVLPPGGVQPSIPADAVSVGLSEWSVKLTTTTAPAGNVTFNVANKGSAVHDLVVIKTDVPPDQLPIDPSILAVDTDAAGLERIARSESLGVGESQLLTAPLQAGSYVLICNVQTHYAEGMHTGFTVQ
jgi:uncharacterized cupredoxin-like copper-binding protein